MTTASDASASASAQPVRARLAIFLRADACQHDDATTQPHYRRITGDTLGRTDAAFNALLFGAHTLRAM
jgi:hypothetical protein